MNTRTVKGIVTACIPVPMGVWLRIGARKKVYFRDMDFSEGRTFLGRLVKIKCETFRKINKTLYRAVDGVEILNFNFEKNKLPSFILEAKGLVSADRTVAVILYSVGRTSLAKKFCKRPDFLHRYVDNIYKLYLNRKVDFDTAVSVEILLRGLPTESAIEPCVYNCLERKNLEEGVQSVLLDEVVEEVTEFFKCFGISVKRDKIVDIIYRSSRFKVDYGTQEVFLKYLWLIRTKIKDILSKEIRKEYSGDELLDAVANHRYLVVTGSQPGVGKTTAVKNLLDYGFDILFTATTGKAAKNLPGGITIHKVLNYGKKFEKKTFNEDIVVVDEASMLTLPLLYRLLCCEHNKIIFVGDLKQAPPVKGENVFQYLLETLPVVNMTKLYRTDKYKTVEIVKNSYKDAFLTIRALVKHFTRERVSWQVIAPFYGGIFGADRINREIVKMFSKNGTKPYGHRMVVLENFYQNNDLIAANGDLCTLIETNGNTVTVKLSNDRVVHLPVRIVYPAYCTSIHKFQGSEADYIIYCLDKKSGFGIDPELDHVARTRARIRTYVVVVN